MQRSSDCSSSLARGNFYSFIPGHLSKGRILHWVAQGICYGDRPGARERRQGSLSFLFPAVDLHLKLHDMQGQSAWLEKNISLP